MKNELEQLAVIQHLAKATKWQRLWHSPTRYIYAMFQRHILYALRKRGSLQQAATFWGDQLQVLLPASIDIYLLGAKTHDSEIRLARWLIQELRQGDTFIDIGAHFGFFSLLAAHLTGKQGHILAFEAAPNTYQLLQKNTHKHPQIEAVHQAVSNQKELLTFYEFPILFSEFNTLHTKQFEKSNWLKNNPPKSVEVQAVALDAVFATRQLQPTIIKMDVEGAELQALRGMEQTLHQLTPRVVMEFSSSSLEAHLEAVRWMKHLGFEAFFIEDDGRLTIAIDPVTYLEQHQLESDNIVFVSNTNF